MGEYRTSRDAVIKTTAKKQRARQTDNGSEAAHAPDDNDEIDALSFTYLNRFMDSLLNLRLEETCSDG